MYKYFFKRLFDIVFSLLAIVILLLPMIIIAIAVRCDSKGRAFFVQERYGKNKKVFKCYKFRSMSEDAPHEMATKDFQGGQYITKVGHFLRKTSLDEIPQLFNILKGDMSFIGPRPVILSETELTEYREACGALKIRPGLTGLAQVSGRDHLVDMSVKAEIDGIYAKNLSFFGDIKIFFKTVKKVLKQEDIVETATVEVPEDVIVDADLEVATTDVTSEGYQGETLPELAETNVTEPVSENQVS